jgi:hypothetical protein
MYASGYFVYDLALYAVVACAARSRTKFHDPLMWVHHVFGIAIFPIQAVSHQAPPSPSPSFRLCVCEREMVCVCVTV